MFENFKRHVATAGCGQRGMSVQCGCKYYKYKEARLTLENSYVLIFLKENEEYVNWTNKKG